MIRSVLWVGEWGEIMNSPHPTGKSGPAEEEDQAMIRSILWVGGWVG